MSTRRLCRVCVQKGWTAMVYLEPAEYAAYGLTSETTDDWITMASALIDSYCRRPSLTMTTYLERIRLTVGAQSVRLSYGPIDPATALTGVRVRYGRPRRGELAISADPLLGQVAYAFWTSWHLELARYKHGGRKCCCSGIDLPGELPGIELQRSGSDL